jgi:Domain of unknown function (DUF4398)
VCAIATRACWFATCRCGSARGFSARDRRFSGGARSARTLLFSPAMKTNLIVFCQPVAAASLAVGMLACGANLPPPNDEWAAAQADVGRAQAGGAPSVPAAKLHLQLAEEDLAMSKQLFDRNNQRASTLVTLARTEAQLARSLSKEAVAQNEASAAEDTLAKSTGR